jgi:broad specificity phosphatase PhoE
VGSVFLYFARHGESEANLSRTFSNRNLPHHLTTRGIQHAAQLADQLVNRASELWCSPVPRAVETASTIGKALRIPYQRTDGLREIDVGRYEGTSLEDGWDEYHETIHEWLVGNLDSRVGGGESLGEAVQRLDRLIQTFLRRGAPQTGVALISHGGLLRMALPHILSNVSPEFAFNNTPGYGQLVVGEVRSTAVACIDWCGASPD